MTEDTVRFATAQALVGSGVPADRLWTERPHPAIGGARIDLTIGEPPSTLIEFKFPREPADTNGPRTQMLGGILRDFYRLATYPGVADRYFVLLETASLRSYLQGRATKFGIELDRPTVVLDREQVNALPATALSKIERLTVDQVIAKQTFVTSVDDEARLIVYLVESVSSPGIGSRTDVADRISESRATIVSETASQSRPRAREEILLAVDDILARSGSTVFSLNDVLVELRRRGTTHAESTIRTMVCSHMCANSPNHNAVTWNDLWRVGRGTYRKA